MVGQENSLPDWPSACSFAVRLLDVQSGDVDERVRAGQQGKDAAQIKNASQSESGGTDRSWRETLADKSYRRFVYLATGETEKDFGYALDLLSPDSDAIFCVW